jgi:uncharacterized protein
MFKQNLNKNILLEKERIFCKHDLNHFLDVARIAYILALENKLPYEKDIIYGAALLHDIGKWQQYEEKIPHEKSSAVLSENILYECGYTKEEVILIMEAILNHRKHHGEINNLNSILYIADKASRCCFSCQAVGKCNWNLEKRNLKIKY